MLAKDPALRYQTSRDLIADLREVAYRDVLTRSQSLGATPEVGSRDTLTWLGPYVPWVAAATLVVATTLWLHVESTQRSNEIRIPRAARTPSPVARTSVGRAQPTLPRAPADRGFPDAFKAAPIDRSESVFGGEADPDSANSRLEQTSESEIDLVPPPPPRSGPESTVEPISATLPESSAVETALAISDDTDRSRLSVPPLPLGIQPNPTPSADSATNAPPRVIRIVEPELLSQSPSDDEATIHVADLGDALTIAAEQDLHHIELAVRSLVSAPVSIATDDLSISSAVGGTMVTFDASLLPSSDVADQGSHRCMLAVSADGVALSDLHLVVDATAGVVAPDLFGCALLRVDEGRPLKMSRCSLTIHSQQPDDTFGIVIEPPAAPSAGAPQNSTWRAERPTRIELNDVIARGQMSLIRIGSASSLQLDWNNGLLAITGRMILAQRIGPSAVPYSDARAGNLVGLRDAVAADADVIDLTLTRLTAHAPLGLLRWKLARSDRGAILIDRFARKCLFLVDSRAPYFEVADGPGGTSPLRLSGLSNVYVVDALSDVMLSVAREDGPPATTSMSELVSAPPAWSTDTTSNWSTWSLPGPLPAHQRTPADYERDHPMEAGFEMESLPVIPRFVPAACGPSDPDDSSESRDNLSTPTRAR